MKGDSFGNISKVLEIFPEMWKYFQKTKGPFQKFGNISKKLKVVPFDVLEIFPKFGNISRFFSYFRG